VTADRPPSTPPGGDFDITVSRTGDVVVVAVRGAVDMLTAPELRAALKAALATDLTALVVDLTAVNLLASSGMSALLSAHNTAAPDVRLAVAADGPGTSRPLRIAGLSDILDVHPTLAEATAAVIA
jgi:anti-sigma B factor antagonist